jgi:hypothetical protein
MNEVGDSMNEVYTLYGQKYQFNDSVNVLFTFEDDACGRLVQVRKGVGQFGSDIYFIRRLDGKLSTFENVGLIHSKIEYPDQNIDTTESEYTIRQKFPEKGFIIENPKQPQSESPVFGITITSEGVNYFAQTGS